MKLIVFQIEEVWVKAMGENTFGMTKGLPYGIFMKRTIQDIIGNGELQRIKMKWKTKSLDCKSATSTGGKPLSFEKSISLFILIFVGTILALVLFILELIFKLSTNCMNSNQLINVTFGRVTKYPSEKIHFKFNYLLNHERKG